MWERRLLIKKKVLLYLNSLLHWCVVRPLEDLLHACWSAVLGAVEDRLGAEAGRLGVTDHDRFIIHKEQWEGDVLLQFAF